MRNGFDVSGKLTNGPKDKGKRFDQTTILLHWLTVLLITIQFATAWLRGAVHHETSLAAAILTIHRTAGTLTWFVVLIRLVWRHRFAYLPPFPESMPKLQQAMAKANEYGLYLLLFLQPITGLCGTLFHGQPFQLLVWNIPALVAPNPEIRVLFVEAHEFGAKVLIALIGLLTASVAYAVALWLRSEDSYAPLIFTSTLPLLLTSGVLLPLSFAPQWLRSIAALNPLLVPGATEPEPDR